MRRARTSSSGAIISDDGLYRYWLDRGFPNASTAAGPPLVFCMLNPSTADSVEDDPTIRRCMDFANREGASGIVVVNLYAFRSSDPKKMFAAADPVGPENGEYVLGAAATGENRLVCAWGAQARPHVVDNFVSAMKSQGVQLLCLGVNKDGSPKHPLYLKKDTPLVLWVRP